MTDEFRADPNRPAYQGSNRPLDPAKCKAGVWSGSLRWKTYEQCNRKAVRDGWCKQHHPEAEAERQKAATEKYERESRRFALGLYGGRFMEALMKIRDGDNDPRATAAEALKGCKYADDPR